jgi:hypothetical protein
MKLRSGISLSYYCALINTESDDGSLEIHFRAQAGLQFRVLQCQLCIIYILLSADVEYNSMIGNSIIIDVEPAHRKLLPILVLDVLLNTSRARTGHRM